MHRSASLLSIGTSKNPGQPGWTILSFPRQWVVSELFQRSRQVNGLSPGGKQFIRSSPADSAVPRYSGDCPLWFRGTLPAYRRPVPSGCLEPGTKLGVAVIPVANDES